jgi:hypothetical protein
LSEQRTAKVRLARIALLALAPVLAVLIPQIAGVQTALLVPVRYAKVALPERAPAVISLAVPVTELTIAPASLGYFSPAGEFVYSADVDRGLIYGYKPGTAAPVYVVEIAAPQQAREFIDQHLERIRTWTRELNTRRNRLRLERLELDALPARPAALSLASQFWDKADAADGDASEGQWLVRGAGYGAGAAGDLAALLEAQAGRRAKMKELYYAALEARLELALAQYELQLALARLPERSGPVLLPQPTAAQIAMLELQRLDGLKLGWAQRQARLEQCLATAPSARFAAEPLDVTSFVPGSGVLPQLGAPAPQVQPVALRDARVNLKLAAQAAQQRLWQAELTASKLALYRLGVIERQVAQAAGQEQQGLPRFSVDQALLDQPALSLQTAAQVEALTGEEALIAGLLLKLERLYEGGRGTPGPQAIEEQLQDLRPKGEEVPCGLLAVDHCVRSAAGKPATLEQQLGSILNAPDAYGIAALDPGYLRFMQWYAGVVQDAVAAQAQPAAPLAAPSKP